MMRELLAAMGRIARSPSFKFFLILFLVVLLLVPLYLASVVIEERSSRANDVRAEVGRLWGPDQRILGPFLVVPYTVRLVETDDGKRVERLVERHAIFTPELLDVSGRADARILHRSIYDVPVYAAQLKFAGRFGPARIADVEPDGVEAVRWGDAQFVLSLSGVSGLKSGAALRVDATTDIPFSPSVGIPANNLEGVHARLAAAQGWSYSPDKPFTFAVDLNFNGSIALSIAPVAKETRVSLESDWPNPSFVDEFLPSERTVTSKGFAARWNVPHLARSVPEAWSLAQAGPERFAPYVFGVRFLDPVDFYTLVTRAVKYGVLFVALAFLAIFCMELVAGRRVHSVQYLFTGVALVFFYVLLLSFAEHIGFAPAYAIASASTGLMLAIYVGAVLSSLRQGAAMALVLAMLFGILYFILQLEDYALLAGALLGFAALTFAMFATLRVDWAGGRLEAPPVAKT
jgi:inner membrane protein